MKKIIFLILLFIFPMMVNAICTDDQEILYARLANNVKASYTYTLTNRGMLYTITLSNITNDMRILDNYNVRVYKNYPTGSEIVINTYGSGEFKFDIYSRRCGGKLATKSVVLPKYNIHSSDDRCAGLENYDVCNRWSGYTANQTKFEKDLKIANEDKANRKVKIEEKPQKKTTFFSKIITFLIKYSILIIGVLSILIIILGSVYKKRRSKNEFNFKL